MANYTNTELKIQKPELEKALLLNWQEDTWFKDHIQKQMEQETSEWICYFSIEETEVTIDFDWKWNYPQDLFDIWIKAGIQFEARFAYECFEDGFAGTVQNGVIKIFDNNKQEHYDLYRYMQGGEDEEFVYNKETGVYRFVDNLSDEMLQLGDNEVMAGDKIII